jgi:hypothetical protein
MRRASVRRIREGLSMTNAVTLVSAAPPPARPCPLAAGLHVQVYCDTLAGEGHAAKVASFAGECARLRMAGAAGVVVHVFPGCTRADFEDYARAARGAALQCSVAFGLSDYQSHHAEQAARAMAAVAASPLCDALLLDAEGGWENDPTDRAAAVTLGRVLRALVPAAWICDQPWPMPTLHGSFPDAEFGAFVDASARQLYVNDWAKLLGTERARKMLPRFEASIATVVHRLHLEHVRQLATIQGYGWSGIAADLVDILMTHYTEPLFVWSEPEPEPLFYVAARAVHASAGGYLDALRALGAAVDPVDLALAERDYRGPDRVQRYQTDHGLTPDGVAGKLTRAALGLPPAGWGVP